MPKMAVITGFLGRTKDRFHDYNQALDLDGKFSLLSAVPGFDGVECVYPYEVGQPTEFKAALARHGLKPAAINCNVKAEPEFVNGGLTSSEPAIRAKAVGFLKGAKDFARAVGADKVTCCPLGDGYEFPFQYDYATTWTYLVDTFAEAGEYLPEIPLFIEYKPKETRGRCFIDTAAKTLLLLNEIGNPNMGVTLDFGHSMYGNEHPPEAVALVSESDYPLYVHINDNDGTWDWDYFCATKNFLEYVEFLFYLRKYNYSDYLTSDTSPTRWDIRGTFEANGRITNKIWELLEGLGDSDLGGLIAGGDYLKTWRFIEENIFGLK